MYITEVTLEYSYLRSSRSFPFSRYYPYDEPPACSQGSRLMSRARQITESSCPKANREAAISPLTHIPMLGRES